MAQFDIKSLITTAQCIIIIPALISDPCVWTYTMNNWINYYIRTQLTTRTCQPFNTVIMYVHFMFQSIGDLSLTISWHLWKVIETCFDTTDMVKSINVQSLSKLRKLTDYWRMIILLKFDRWEICIYTCITLIGLLKTSYMYIWNKNIVWTIEHDFH